jgi:tRNA G37 N-methylase Trm5
VSNPARAGSMRHEAEKDPAEVLPILRAVLRPGECVLDCFAGAGAWIPAALAEGYDVLAVEKQPAWASALAEGRTQVVARD